MFEDFLLFLPALVIVFLSNTFLDKDWSNFLGTIAFFGPLVYIQIYADRYWAAILITIVAFFLMKHNYEEDHF
jgi:hypothetical protein